MHRKVLGRGLEALIPNVSAVAVDSPPVATEPNEADVLQLSVEDVAPNPFQPRTRYDPEAMSELAASIKATGVLQPVLVRRSDSGYQLVAGERRLRAARQAGLDHIPALVREITDNEMMEMALIENIQREDLNPIDEAKAYQMLASKAGLTHDTISDRVGKQRSSISNSLRLLGLPVEVQEMVSRGTLTAGHARALLSLESSGDQLSTARYVHSKAFSVRRTEALIRRKLRLKHTRPRNQKAGDLGEWENKLQQKFATRVVIHPGRKGGKVEFEYYGQEDLERLFESWGIL